MQGMQVKKLDHVNIHTANVDRLVEWYDRVLGMKAGNRPPFPFPGAWLYCGGSPPSIWLACRSSLKCRA